ncbi:MAG: Odd Oz/ten-m homolog 4 [uncultured Sulfurovum sp.]|uniref:Odd Oz/ten-m homolog 4 n=1 Tax=uncultured Sulfurovum sp. TaxID=269237 RepID=A0A6S6SF65_9BACT|nr:MAG: Odd Oz/ten-m homolog 4 [uncultured Sulfurovum sp.]
MVKSVTPYGLNKMIYTYDDKGRVSRTKQGKRKVTYTYDARGNIASTKDALGRATRFEYDNRDRVVKTIYPNGNMSENIYDKNGNMTTLRTPRPSDHTFSFNGVNKRTGMKSPLGFQTTYDYDKQRRVTKITRPSGNTINHTYNNGRVTSTTTAEGTTNYTYSCQGNVVSKTKASESINYEYDGTLLTKATQSGQLNQTFNFGYNNDFLLSSFSYAGASSNYSYNNDNELTQVGDYGITRSSQNRVKKISDGTYNQTVRYNKYGEIRQFKDKRTIVTVSYNKLGKITKKVEKVNGKKRTYKYTYDKLGRLTKVKKGKKVVERYTYDSNGNRATAKVYGKKSTASYTLDDQLEVYGNNTYRYDNDGYLSEKTTPNGTTTYSYGTLGELKKVLTPTQTIEYLHNANNQRVAKKVNGEIVEKYLWTNLTTLLVIYDKDDNLIQRFEYADNRMPISMTQNNKKYYLHYDQVGTLKAVSDSSLKILKEISYDTYGNILKDTNPSFKVPFGFAGGLYDTDTQLTRFGYRDYDAYTGKWMAKDPIDFAGGDSNLYGYVLQDPVSGVDPSGLFLANLIGATINLGFEGYIQYQAGELNVGRLLVAAGTGALGGFGSTFGRAIGFGTVAGATNNAYQQLEADSCKDFDYGGLARSVGFGAAGGGLGYLGSSLGNGILKDPTQRYLNNAVFPRTPVFSTSPRYGAEGSAIGASVGGILGNQ